MRELVIACEGELDGYAKAFDSHDADGADEGADGDVNDWVRASVPWDDDIDHDEREYKHGKAIKEEACE